MHQGRQPCGSPTEGMLMGLSEWTSLWSSAAKLSSLLSLLSEQFDMFSIVQYAPYYAAIIINFWNSYKIYAISSKASTPQYHRSFPPRKAVTPLVYPTAFCNEIFSTIFLWRFNSPAAWASEICSFTVSALTFIQHFGRAFWPRDLHRMWASAGM